MGLLSKILRIVIIDLVLSGDNAVVIGMAAHRLDPRRRRVAILIGGGAAIALRIVLTAIAALLLQLSGLQLVGGLLLLWIGFKLLKQQEESLEGIKVATSMQEAVVTILLADFIMSLDNVLGVAGASDGNLALLVLGLVLSMAILMFTGNLVAELVNRVRWLGYVGSGVIAWTGAAMIFDDALIRRRFPVEGLVRYAMSVIITMAILMFAHWFHRGRAKPSG